MPPVTPRRICLPMKVFMSDCFLSFALGEGAQCVSPINDLCCLVEAKIITHSLLTIDGNFPSSFYSTVLPHRTIRHCLFEEIMPITDWPEGERPREKLLQKGPQSLSDAELLAIFLRTGVRGKTAVDLARDLLLEFGSLRGLLESDFEHFSRARGLGNAKYALLQAVLEMARRHLKETLRRSDVLTSPDLTRSYLTARLRGYAYEVFACLFLDNQHRIIEFEELFRGTIDGASVYPREVVKKALAFNAAAVIFAHNHPSGIAEPSEADKFITHKLKQAMFLLDIRVLDHFIIGDGEAYSFAEHGLL
jgi:DNA repair protein RadC